MSSLPVTKLGYDTDQVEHEFEKWQRERSHEARIAFDQMLGENSFVEFWGRLGKIGGRVLTRVSNMTTSEMTAKTNRLT